MFIKSFGNFLKQEIYEKFLETFKASKQGIYEKFLETFKSKAKQSK